MATEFELDKASRIVENLGDLRRLKVRIYSTQTRNSTFALEYEDMIRNTIFTNASAFTCIKKLNQSNDRVCVDLDLFIHLYSARIKRSNLKIGDNAGKGRKKSNFVIRLHYLTQLLKNNSSYGKTVSNSFEAGLLKSFTPKEFVNLLRRYEDDEDYNVIGTNDLEFSMLH